MTWAVLHCRYYLQGLQEVFVITDHRPLAALINGALTEASDRAFRVLSRIAEFNLTAIFTPGKDHQVADALSRLPATDTWTDLGWNNLKGPEQLLEPLPKLKWMPDNCETNTEAKYLDAEEENNNIKISRKYVPESVPPRIFDIWFHEHTLPPQCHPLLMNEWEAAIHAINQEQAEMDGSQEEEMVADESMKEIRRVAAEDQDYQDIINAIKQGGGMNNLSNCHPAKISKLNIDECRVVGGLIITQDKKNICAKTF